jgi:hypothetical protein
VESERAPGRNDANGLTLGVRFWATPVAKLGAWFA